MPIHTFGDYEEIRPAKLGQTDWKIVRTEDKIAASGSEMLVLHCEQRGTGAHKQIAMVFTKAAAWKVEVILKACGIAHPKGTQLDIGEALMVGKTFSAEAYEEPYTKKDGTEGMGIELRNWRTCSGGTPEATATAPAQVAAKSEAGEW